MPEKQRQMTVKCYVNVCVLSFSTSFSLFSHFNHTKYVCVYLCLLVCMYVHESIDITVHEPLILYHFISHIHYVLWFVSARPKYTTTDNNNNDRPAKSSTKQQRQQHQQQPLLLLFLSSLLCGVPEAYLTQNKMVLRLYFKFIIDVNDAVPLLLMI